MIIGLVHTIIRGSSIIVSASAVPYIAGVSLIKRPLVWLSVSRYDY